MDQWKIKASLFLNYFVFAILLNSVGTVILQVQTSFGVTEGSASVLEAFKDLSIAIASFFISGYIIKIGYKRAMQLAIGAIMIICFLVPFIADFLVVKLLFAAIGISFAFIKMSVYGTIGLITKNEKEHISLMNFLESFFMVGILAGYFIFSLFVDENDPASRSWLNVYFVLGALCLIAFILLGSAKLNDRSLEGERQHSFLQEFGEMFSLMVKPLVLVFIFSAFFYVLIEQSIMSWLPTFNSKVLHLPNFLSIEMASILAASTAVGRFLAGLVLKKVSWFPTLVVCLLLAASLVILAIPMAQTVKDQIVTGWGDAPLAAFIFPLIGLFLAPVYPAINSVVLSSLPVQKHGIMSGLIIIFSALGGTTGSIITGNIFQYYGGENAFYFSLIPITILIICLSLFKRMTVRSKIEVEKI